MYEGRYISYLKESDRTFFAKCCEDHNNGVLFPFHEITKDQLEQLYIKERVTDLMLAELFGVNQTEIMKKRSAFKLYQVVG
jgi:hypothetical protein